METRRLTQTARILALLKKQGWATNAELNKICYRYAARIHELRNEGYRIVTYQIKDGLFEYRYFGIKQEKEFDDIAD